MRQLCSPVLYSKLELIYILHKKGWQVDAAAAAFIEKDQPFIYPKTCWQRSLYSLAALVVAPDIFKKGVDKVYFGLPENYYKALFKLPNLRILKARDCDVPRFSSSQWSVYINTGKLPLLDPGGFHGEVILAIADRDLPDGFDVMHVVDDDYPPIEVQVPGQAIRNVLFDNCSHHSGIRRAYIACAKHEACFRYAQINTAPTLTMLVSRLVAWAVEGVEQNLSREDHQTFHPSDVRVKEMHEMCYPDLDL